MINIEFDTKEINQLTKDLKALNKGIKEESNWAIKTLYKGMNDVYTAAIDELVYEQYEPAFYERTYHLAGKHGAKIEEFNIKGLEKYYKFEIDGNSRDPVDGETWFEKARKIENGYEEMKFKQGSESFNRPFIEETQERMYFEAKRTADGLERSIELSLDKVVNG